MIFVDLTLECGDICWVNAENIYCILPKDQGYSAIWSSDNSNRITVQEAPQQILHRIKIAKEDSK